MKLPKGAVIDVAFQKHATLAQIGVFLNLVFIFFAQNHR
jgi:hypothetical protein